MTVTTSLRLCLFSALSLLLPAFPCHAQTQDRPQSISETLHKSVLYGPIVNPSNGHAYSLLDGMTWTGAEATAAALGGHLATIRNEAEDNWIFTTFYTFGGVNRNLWIGINDAQTTGHYVWASGETTTYTHWAKDQPDHAQGVEHYGAIWRPATGGELGRWNDFPDNGYNDPTRSVYGVAEVTSGQKPNPIAEPQPTSKTIHEAADRGDLLAIQRFVAQDAKAVNALYNGGVPLHNAAYCGHLEIVQFLLEHGADVNAKQTDGNTPLNHAAFRKNYEVAKYLLEHGANPNIVNKDGTAPLHHAAYVGNAALVHLLLDYGADPEPRQTDGATPLRWATERGYPEVARMIQAKINERAAGQVNVKTPTTARNTSGLQAVESKPAKRAYSIGLALGADSRTEAPAHPGPKGLLVVTGNDTQVQAPPGTFFELQPQSNRPGFVPEMLYLANRTTLMEKKDVDGPKNLPFFIVDAPHDGRLLPLTVYASDARQKTVEMMRCTLTSGKPNAADIAKLMLKDERIRLQQTEGTRPKALYFFLENDYLGCVRDNLDKFAVDARRLPLGQHLFQVIPETADGVLLPPVSSTITVTARYRLACAAQNSLVTVGQGADSVNLRVTREDGTNIVKTYVYIAGCLAGESDKAGFDMPLPLTNVPTGRALVEVVGVGKDGSLYPPESLELRVSNIITNAVAARSQDQRDLQTALGGIGKIDQEIEYWYTRACNEPDFVTYSSGASATAILATDGFARVASVTYVSSITVPGRVAEYLGECRAAIVRRAQARLQIGKLYKKTGQADAARRTLQQAVQEAGEESGIGSEAARELKGL